ncbi:MAG: ATP-dependent Clp protease proteolytic subunit [Bdellovibrio sp. CG12_big_fil_rev_8_21_14_0_65_39_13]|nr:MAG: ATP-dependent Clp protease proteolytic subunit [Bdellovibrio sp. CG22_combo_CG10-13_8_21_14_all_39_27]PIQ58743.1 MAG: ATP-dependent Clp protease proteolytic subunit [Bdellovibrio sp. CG12_big_fil_rev_8_21_14_0_65_39_13]PIR35576.1 MAG: ATP-dependent Clp protease proteolytic subunit [Bdellovibrio sp. CG11_big_fil_rev_8_21_14_0_20_39_38]
MTEKTNNELERNISFTPIDQKLYDSRVVFLSGVVNDELAYRVNRELLSLEEKDQKAPILLWVNSPGGEVDSGFSIYDTIQFIKPEVVTIVSGMAASMASVIALAAEKHNRLAFPNAHILIHQPLIGGTIQGPASDIKIHAKRIMELKNKIHKLYADRTGTPIQDFEEMMDRDYSLSADEALKLGLISNVISSREEIDKWIRPKSA